MNCNLKYAALPLQASETLDKGITKCNLRPVRDPPLVPYVAKDRGRLAELGYAGA